MCFPYLKTRVVADVLLALAWRVSCCSRFIIAQVGFFRCHHCWLLVAMTWCVAASFGG